MPVKKSVEIDAVVPEGADGADLLLPLVAGRPATGPAAESGPGVVVGGVVAITDVGRTPLVVMGVIRDGVGSALADQPGTVDVDADGERLMVSAREQLVLRCGKASITLTKAGKVLIEGAYVSSRSSGVNRVKGGSVQLN